MNDNHPEFSPDDLAYDSIMEAITHNQGDISSQERLVALAERLMALRCSERVLESNIVIQGGDGLDGLMEGLN